jgi:hypothetical protein
MEELEIILEKENDKEQEINLLEEEIKEVYPELEDIEITPTTEEQIFTSVKYGFGNVIVKRVNLQDKEIILNKNGIYNIKADKEYLGLNNIEVTLDAIEDLSSELIEQDSLLITQETTIDNIITALEGKSVGGGGITPSNKGGNSKTYEITLLKTSGKILLLELDDDVLAHIDDPKLTVTLINVSGYSFEKYSVSFVTISNTVFAVQGDIQMYGMALRQGTETGTTLGRVSCPANNTDENIAGSNIGWFIWNDRNYYVKPADGFMRSGTYKLTFSW